MTELHSISIESKKNPNDTIFFFGNGIDYPQFPSVETVGSKAYNLMKLTNLGLPIPPGFVLSTSFCHDFFVNGQKSPSDFLEMLQSNIKKFETMTRFTFGGSRRPLLVSVRSGAAVSMPGMMDTILNVGLCDSTISGLIRMTGNPRFVWDSYGRLVKSYAEVVHHTSPDPFDSVLKECLQKNDVQNSSDLDSEELEHMTREYLQIFKKTSGKKFPQSLLEQLIGAVEAVFKSWESQRAIEYRRIRNITGLMGTAVIIQTMVFGNMGITSGSGVGFTRNPTTGENTLFLDYLSNAQGEDVVSGKHLCRDVHYLHTILPQVYSEIQSMRRTVELAFKDVQDFEFTVQEGKLFLLQSRTGKRTPWAALKIAVDLVNEGIIDHITAIKRLEEYDIHSIKRPKILSKSVLQSLSIGTSASHGVVVGKIAFTSEKARELKNAGDSVILVRQDILTDDLEGISTSDGILTAMGGRTSHAAVVARQLDKACIVGCHDLIIIPGNNMCKLAQTILNEGDYISLDANSGNVYNGKLEIVDEKPTELISQIEKWK
ncbi:MAG: pyruvate, phosphate dikinase [Nitrosopumilales archaeon]|nr:MAG: pyruvate, phosphate dikinase [Nitrosopumilales archaeon]